MRRSWWLVILIVLVSVIGFSAWPTKADSWDERVPEQYIVVLKDSKDSVENPGQVVREVAREHGVAPGLVYEYALKGFSATIPAARVEKIKQDSRVAFISEDRPVSIEAQSIPTGVDRINAENKPNTGTGVHVAVLDTGIDLKHSDLKANIVGGKNCSSGSSYADGNGHGTHVAGTIAAVNNTIGVVGVAPGVKLWSVRVLNNSGSGTWSSVICGIDFVTSKAPGNGGSITVANMSLGGGGISDNNCGDSNNDALHKAICRSRDAGVTYVVAAGNSGADAAKSVPAAYDDAVITVAALADSNGQPGGTGSSTNYGADDTLASFSNYGSVVDIAAPGVNIKSTWKGGGYKTISGTSMATPHVAGAAALYIAMYPGATWQQVRDGLVALGEAVGAGHTDLSGLHPEPVVRVDVL